MNSIWKKLVSTESTPKAKRLNRPYTLGIDKRGEVLETREGKLDFSDFKNKEIVILNICHKNGRTTVINKPI